MYLYRERNTGININTRERGGGGCILDALSVFDVASGRSLFARFPLSCTQVSDLRPTCYPPSVHTSTVGCRYLLVAVTVVVEVVEVVAME